MNGDDVMDNDYEVVDVYVGVETTIYYDTDGCQHVVVNEVCNEKLSTA